MTRSRGYERWRKMTWKPEQTANPVQTTAFSWGKKGFPGDGDERMKNNAEITYYASYNKLMDLSELSGFPLPSIGQTPALDSDKQRLAFRTEADTEGWRAGLPCK